MSQSNKRFLLTGIIVLIAIGGIIYLQKNSKTPNDNTVNKTILYKKPEFGISFEYPINMFLVKENLILTISPISPNDPRFQSSASMGNLTIKYEPYNNVEILKEEFASSTASTTNIFIDSKEAVKIVSLPDGYSGGSWVNILFQSKQGVIRINYLEGTSYGEKYRSIIQSIRFI